MSAALESVTDAKEAATRLIRAHSEDPGWLDAFAQELDRRRAADSLVRVLAVWDLNQSEAAQLFGVSRQALSKWLGQGVPAERCSAVADLAAATDILAHYLKRDRIGAAVRRKAPALDGESLLDLVAVGETSAMLKACRAMFSFADAHS